MRRDHAWLLWVVLAAASCAKTTDPLPDKNTNWLRECSSDSVCGADLSCLCGLCTAACGASSECGASGDGVACKAVDGAALLGQCAHAESDDAVAICVATCKRSADCPDDGADWECRDNVCVKPERGATSGADGGSTALRDGGNASFEADAGDAALETGTGQDSGAGLQNLCGNGRLDTGERCDSTTALTNGRCAQCTLVCDPGFADCNADLADGCERDVGGSADLSLANGCSELLAEGQATPTSIALDTTHLYWTNNGTFNAFGTPLKDGSVVALPLVGGAPVELATDQWSPTALAVNDGYAYWLNQTDNLGHGAVMRVALTGGSAETVTDPMQVTHGLAVDDAYVYFLALDSGADTWSLLQVPKDGSAASEHLLDGLSAPHGVLLWAEGTLYWAGGGWINSFATTATSALVQLTGDFDIPGSTESNLAIHAGALYQIWGGSSVGLGAVKLASGGNGATLEQYPYDGNSSGIAVDASHVYWGHDRPIPGGPAQVSWVIERSEQRPGAGSTALLVDPSLGFPMLAVTDEALYIVAAGDRQSANGLVVRIAK